MENNNTNTMIISVDHVFGSCLVNGKSDTSHAAYHRDNRCSKRLPNFGAIHHFLGIFYGAPEKSDNFHPPFQRDEYSEFALRYFVNETSVTVTDLDGNIRTIER